MRAFGQTFVRDAAIGGGREVPIAPTVFWGPMAYAIMGGLAVATVLTLVFLPALYVAWFRIKRPNPDAGSTMHFEEVHDHEPRGGEKLGHRELEPVCT